jgi:glycosyltransferase involved in cell wall biosynthesis
MTTVGMLIPIRGDADADSVHLALSSVAHQTRPPDQVVIVLDGPAGRDLDAELSSWRKVWQERLTIVPLITRRGVAAALNAGLAYVTTEWVARMDSDDYSDPQRLHVQMSYVSSHAQVDVLGSWLLDYPNDHEHPDRVKTCPEQHEEILALMWFRNPLNHPSVMFKRSTVEGVGGYDAKYGDDDHLWAKLWVAGAQFHNIQMCLVRRRRNEDLFRRRGRRWVLADLNVRGYLRRSGKIGWIRFILSCAAVLALRVSPVWLKKVVYLSFTRVASSDAASIPSPDSETDGPRLVQVSDAACGDAHVADKHDGTKIVWIFHHYGDPPDGYWTGTYDVYKHLVAWGHRVTVFTSSFSHYSRRDDRLGPGETVKEQVYDGMRFIFVKTTPYQSNGWRRALNMLTYAARSWVVALRQSETPDVIVGSIPHPFAGCVAGWMAKRKGCPFILEVHDLWLQYLLDTGALRSWNPLAKALGQIDRWCYRRAAKIIMLWPQMDLYLRGFDVPLERTAWVPIGVPEAAVASEGAHRADGVLRVVWTGRIGAASNVLEILQAAKLLKGRGRRDIQFTLIGGGPDEQQLRQFAEDEGLDNVRFTGVLPKRELPEYLRKADVCVAGLPAVATYSHYGTIPSKLLDYLAHAKPVVFITNMPDNALSRASAGIVVPPDSPAELAEAFERLAAASVEERHRLGDNGRQYVREFHNPQKLAARIADVIDQVST